ncbi:MAG: PQQ-binding-like beta-propeller repeat protein [Polyangiaceae bacterium]
MASVQRQLANVTIPRGADVAVGVFGERSLVGVKLEGGDPWTFEHPLSCRPVIAGNVVVGVGQNEMFGLDARSGKLLWTRKAGGCPRGAADDGKTTVVSTRPVNGKGGIVVAIDRDGLVVRQIQDDANIGVPAIVDGFLFLPWNARYVSAYDLSIGEEVARVRMPGHVTRAFTVGGALFFGDGAATRFDDRIARAANGGASTVGLPNRALPDRPAWMTSGNDIAPMKADVADTARLYARPEASGPATIAGGRYAATHGRVAMGLVATDGSLAWVHAHDATFLGGAAYEGGFALCDAEGRVTFLDARTGAVAGSVLLGIPIDACLVQADAFAKIAPDAPRPLRDQIASAIRLQQEDAAPIQRFLLAELATSTDEKATDTLIQLVADGSAPPGLQPDVRAALASRRLGADAMIAALSQRYDFLDDAPSGPPVGPLAEALAGMNDHRAAPLLAEHLVDPSTPSADVERVAAALEKLAGPAELPELRQFFAAYRSEESDAPLVLAVAHIAGALTRLGDTATVTEAATDPYTSDAVRTKLPGGKPTAASPAR